MRATSGSPIPSTATPTTGRRSTRSRFPGYEKLDAMGRAVHERWRPLDRAGGAGLRRSADRRDDGRRRRDGETLRRAARRGGASLAGRARPHQLERVQREHAHRAERGIRRQLPQRRVGTPSVRSSARRPISTRASPQHATRPVSPTGYRCSSASSHSQSPSALLRCGADDSGLRPHPTRPATVAEATRAS